MCVTCKCSDVPVKANDASLSKGTINAKRCTRLCMSVFYGYIYFGCIMMSTLIHGGHVHAWSLPLADALVPWTAAAAAAAENRDVS